MHPTEKFMRFAAECQHMAQFARVPEDRTAWTSMAERWMRCAEAIEQQVSQARTRDLMKRHRKAAFDLAL
jgi:hypothetical protein